MSVVALSTANLYLKRDDGWGSSDNNGYGKLISLGSSDNSGYGKLLQLSSNDNNGYGKLLQLSSSNNGGYDSKDDYSQPIPYAFGYDVKDDHGMGQCVEWPEAYVCVLCRTRTEPRGEERRSRNSQRLILSCW